MLDDAIIRLFDYAIIVPVRVVGQLCSGAKLSGYAIRQLWVPVYGPLILCSGTGLRTYATVGHVRVVGPLCSGAGLCDYGIMRL